MHMGIVVLRCFETWDVSAVGCLLLGHGGECMPTIKYITVMLVIIVLGFQGSSVSCDTLCRLHF